MERLRAVEAVASRDFKQWEGRCSDGREGAEIHQHQHASIEQMDREGWILSHSLRRGGPTTASCNNFYNYLMSEKYQKSPFLKCKILLIKISKRVSRPSLTNLDFFCEKLKPEINCSSKTSICYKCGMFQMLLSAESSSEGQRHIGLVHTFGARQMVCGVFHRI